MYVTIRKWKSVIVLSKIFGLNYWWVLKKSKEIGKNTHVAIIILKKRLCKNIIIKFKVAQL